MIRSALALSTVFFAALAGAQGTVEVTLADPVTRHFWVTDGWPKKVEDGSVVGGSGSVANVKVNPDYAEPYLIIDIPEENRMAVIDMRGRSQYGTSVEDHRFLSLVLIKTTGSTVKLEDGYRTREIPVVSGVATAVGVPPGTLRITAGGKSFEREVALGNSVPTIDLAAPTAESKSDGGPSPAVFLALIPVFLGAGIAIATSVAASRRKAAAKPAEGP